MPINGLIQTSVELPSRKGHCDLPAIYTPNIKDSSLAVVMAAEWKGFACMQLKDEN